MATPQQFLLGTLETQDSTTPSFGSVQRLRMVAEDADTDGRFTRANVFGLLVTIALCLLAQPHGSLLYAKPRGILNRLLFFFWRLNPLACVAEAFLVVAILFTAICSTIKSRWEGSGDDEGRDIWRALRTTATAALLLRGHGQMPDHLRFMGGRRQVVRRRKPVPGTTSLIRASEEQLSSPLLGSDTFSDEASVSSSVDITDWNSRRQTSTSNNARRGLRSRSPVGRVNLANANVSRSRLRISGHGSYHELVVNIIGTLGVLLVVTKLALVVIPKHLHVAAWCMVAGWAAIQFLVLVSRKEEFGLEEDRRVLELAVLIEKRVHSRVLWLLLSALVLPTFGYLIYSFLFHGAAISLRLRVIYLLSWPVFYILVDPNLPNTAATEPITDQPGLVFSEPEPEDTEKFGTSLLSNTIRVTLYMLPGSWFGRSVVQCLTKTIDEVHWSYLPLPFIAGPATMLAWFFLPCLTFFSDWEKAKWYQDLGLRYNIGNVIFAFVCAIIAYDDRQTYKPDWLDWLGKI
ncbi:hypothetical protein V8F33_006452 [Rhypophila sp. PSN 637]